MKDVLEEHLALDEDTTDIFLYVHGWRTTPEKAEDAAMRLFRMVEDLQRGRPDHYPRIAEFRPRYLCVRWPAKSPPTTAGYRAVRERAAAMSHDGQAAHVLACLLGYFNDHREFPAPGPDVMRSAGGQYLHCVGHSFGGRFLSHAIMEASSRPAEGPDTLSWPWSSETYPWTVDSLTVFQMAAPSDAFAHPPFSGLLSDNVLNAPIALTFSPRDRALGLWHRQTENGKNGIGHHGATDPSEHLHTMPLHVPSVPYAFPDPPARILNVDATEIYRESGLRVEGAHSDFFHPESAHLLLTLADHAR
ncbi:alpha/beta hydrolase [Streptomyces sp. ISL-11]|uniref:alpha/beta hydrolase n=1 Tax=Streptomyces sp. ISL-11 TaxID=2819174 RepID=UPI001BE6A73F|nr:alpha/beta hydrolase [Streptomyces sp. ISL-11]MBT2382469.1 alpha/beta hydrolase [Streptomyces sp. ISL-11]